MVNLDLSDEEGGIDLSGKLLSDLPEAGELST